MGKHRKHAKLKLRDNGNFAPNEISILGAKCSIISDLVAKVSENLSNYKLAYFDASHAKDVEQLPMNTYTFHHAGPMSFSGNDGVNKFNQRIQFSQYDYVFINGNHYQGARQVLILDSEKEASVLKRLDQLDNIQFVIKLNEESEYFDFFRRKKFSNKKFNVLSHP